MKIKLLLSLFQSKKYIAAHALIKFIARNFNLCRVGIVHRLTLLAETHSNASLRLVKSCRRPNFIAAATVLMLYICTLPCICEAFAGDKNVIILQSQDIAAYKKAVDGFKEGCKINNISVGETYNLKGDIEEGKRVMYKIRKKEDKPDLIFSVGILAASLAREEFSDIPTIFCMVINHERFNLHGDNITGVAAEVSVNDQFTVLRDILGENATIGVIYNPENTGNYVKQAIPVANRLNLTILKKEARFENEVVPAFDEMIGKIDALWIVPDATVLNKNPLHHIFKTAEKKRLPTFCTSNTFIKAGALLAIYPDYENIGLQSSQIAYTWLMSRESSFTTIEKPRKLNLTINTKTAEKIGIDLKPIEGYPNVNYYP
ncbi:MAG: hypothetical protein FJ264_00390 [Planctomycetes bacterium]|nr:hypothetical protein [Planctomycetota bacterium]